MNNVCDDQGVDIFYDSFYIMYYITSHSIPYFELNFGSHNAFFFSAEWWCARGYCLLMPARCWRAARQLVSFVKIDGMTKKVFTWALV